MSRMFLALITVACVISLASGCRNCRLNPCNNACGIGASPTLPAPPTYSLQIPSLGQNQPYYNGVPTTARQPSYLVNPNSAAPTPASSTPTLAPQQGWRPVGTNQFSNPSVGSTSPNLPQNQPTSVLQSPVDLSPNRAPTGFASQPASTPALNSVLQPSDNRTASAANGISYRDSVNYRSTRVDERQDETRLPVTDASSVRAPFNLEHHTACKPVCPGSSNLRNGCTVEPTGLFNPTCGCVALSRHQFQSLSCNSIRSTGSTWLYSRHRCLWPAGE